MAGTVKRGDPTGEIVLDMIPAGTGGNSISQMTGGPLTVRVPLSESGGTANAGYLSWINPEAFTIMVQSLAVHFYTTGTGTFDMGRGSDGTGSSDDLLNGGTMNTAIGKAIIFAPGGSGTEGIGNTGTTLGLAGLWLLGPGGTGTNNSIIAKTSETATTAKGDVYITYIITNR